ncbi:MAG: hypothetical protein IKC26_00205, partial [Clostridia bacterium]|nr:hypothetical protein [Clostridia bacterium]
PRSATSLCRLARSFVRSTEDNADPAELLLSLFVRLAESLVIVNPALLALNRAWGVLCFLARLFGGRRE